MLQSGDSVVLDTRNAFVLFDGRRAHSVEDFIGERYSLVFFSINQYARTPLEEKAALAQFPDELSLRILTKMLAPARGDHGAQSIWTAFGFADRQQAIRWPIRSLESLPIEALELVIAFVPGQVTAVCRALFVASC